MGGEFSRDEKWWEGNCRGVSAKTDNRGKLSGRGVEKPIL